jgi:hypothetical protein
VHLFGSEYSDAMMQSFLLGASVMIMLAFTVCTQAVGCFSKASMMPHDWWLAIKRELRDMDSFDDQVETAIADAPMHRLFADSCSPPPPPRPIPLFGPSPPRNAPPTNILHGPRSS